MKTGKIKRKSLIDTVLLTPSLSFTIGGFLNSWLVVKHPCLYLNVFDLELLKTN